LDAVMSQEIIDKLRAAHERDSEAFRRWFDQRWNQDDSYGRSRPFMHDAWLAALAWERDQLQADLATLKSAAREYLAQSFCPPSNGDRYYYTRGVLVALVKEEKG
jgi:hypothetical protein